LEKWVLPFLGDRDVAEITANADILAVLQQPALDSRGAVLGSLWTTRTTTADRTRNHIRSVLDWAAAAEYRPKGLHNPATWGGNLDRVLAAPAKVAPVRNHPALDYRRIPALWAQLAGYTGSGADALRFTILTASRINETAKARRDEVDHDPEFGLTWRLPAGRMKGRRPHRQPLSTQVRQLLERLPAEANNPYLFIGRRAGTAITASAIRMCLHRLDGGYAEETVVHGLRSTFRDWAAERTSYAREIAELALAHRIGDDDTERSYLRSDLFEKRRHLLQSWADYCTTPVAPSRTVAAIGTGR
jgi:integrase